MRVFRKATSIVTPVLASSGAKPGKSERFVSAIRYRRVTFDLNSGSSSLVPNVATLVSHDKNNRFEVTQSLQLEGGQRYGTL